MKSEINASKARLRVGLQYWKAARQSEDAWGYGRVLVIGLLFWAGALMGQTISSVSATNPKYPEYYEPPNQTQLKWLLQGAKAESQPEGRVLVTQAKMQEFRTNGETELVIEAPQCTYDRTAHIVSSPGALHVQTGDGRLIMDGMGFFWSQTNSILLISNQVHTFLAAGLLQGGTVQQPAAPGPANVGNLEVTSERFSFDLTNEVATYTGNAQVTGTNLNIKGGSIVVLVPMHERRQQRITIETNMVMDYEQIHVEGDRAVYEGETGLAHVTGNPRWRAEGREGNADELIIDRTNQVFRANGHAQLKLPTEAAGSARFLPAQLGAATNSTAITNRVVEIASDYYEFRTNSGVFGDKVLLTETANEQPSGTLSCGLLNVRFARASGTNELESLVAEKNVVMKQDTNQLAGDKAVYTGSTGNLELTGNPSWQAGPRQGRGDVLIVNAHRGEMLVRGDASMRLPAGELGQPANLAGDQLENPDALDGANRFADVFAEEYTVSKNAARFDRHVRIIHPRMNWSCDKMRVDSAVEGGKQFTITADGGVVFAFSGEKQEPVHGQCERAEYFHNLTAIPMVDRVELTGHPVLETTNATIRNAIIILDQAQQKLILPGEYAMSGRVSGLGTNSFGSLHK